MASAAKTALCCGVSAVGSCCAGMSRKCGERVTKLGHLAMLGAAVLFALIMQNYGSSLVYDVNIGGYAPFQIGCINGHTGFNVTVPYPTGFPSWAQQTSSIFEHGAAAKLENCVGNMVVYRVSFASVLFFAIVGIASTFSIFFHYGCWFAKVVLYTAIIVASFFLPNSFFIVYAWCARIVSIVFLLVQILILLDGAYNLHEWFLRRAFARQESRYSGDDPTCFNNLWMALYTVLSLGCYVGIGVALMLFLGLWIGIPNYYWPDDELVCFASPFIISVTAVFVLVLLFIGMCATHKFDEEAGDNGGGPILLPSAVVAIYVTYLCYSSISQYPDSANGGKCNWLLWDRHSDGTMASELDRPVWSMALSFCVSAFSLGYTALSLSRNAAGALSLVGVSGSVSGTVGDDDSEDDSVESGGWKPLTNTRIALGGGGGDGGTFEDAAAGGGFVGRVAEKERSDAGSDVPWIYREWSQRLIFHIALTLGSWYMAMVLTAWDTTGMHVGTADIAAFWIKLVSQWIVMVLFMWTAVAPFVCANRSFAPQ